MDEPKVKKKRGRKPKPKTEDTKPKIKKKRGRKPKPKTIEDLKPKVKKKKGRKPKIKNLEQTKKPVNKKIDNVILHLPIHSEQLDSEFVEDAYYKLVEVINNHKKEKLNNHVNARNILFKYDPANPDNIEGYTNLIENL